jgi:hypothetical protein
MGWPSAATHQFIRISIRWVPLRGEPTLHTQYPIATPSLRDSVAPKYTSFSASYQIA